MKRTGKFYVYIVECRDGTYYTGSTNNIEKRIALHNSGRGAKYLRGRTPVKVVYEKGNRCYKDALRAERNIKKLSHKEKLELARIYGKKRVTGLRARWDVPRGDTLMVSS